MARHFDRERALQRGIETVLGEAAPAYDVLDVELDEPQETVRVFVDHPDGVGLEQCAQVSELIRDTCPDHALEVSSPGMERPMRHARHFRASVGEKVRLRRSGVHRATVVELVDVDDSAGITVRPDGGESRVVPFDEVVRCRLVVKDPFAAAAAARGSKRKGRGA